MWWLHALILGIVEGVTEFLPVSSTFHLLVTTRLLGIPLDDFTKLLVVIIQAPAILAVLWLFRADLSLKSALWWRVTAAFVPTAIVGLVLNEVISEVFFESTHSMYVIFGVVGVLFFVMEWLVASGRLKLEKELPDITWTIAILAGLAQSTAVFPGVSRAGAVMVGMMLMGFKRADAAKFSFCLAVPTILAAALLDVVKLRDVPLPAGNEWAVSLLLACVVSGFSAWLVMRWFISYLQRRTLTVFGGYRLVVSAALLWLAP
jgi:undecaprenyl-diphosphatase